MQDSNLTRDVELTELNRNTGIVFSEGELSDFSQLCERHIEKIKKSSHDNNIDMTFDVLVQVLTSSEVSAEFQENPSVLLLKNYVTQSEQCRLVLKEKIKALLRQQDIAIESIFFRLMQKEKEYECYQIAEMVMKEFIEEFDITQTIKVGERYCTAIELLAWEWQWELIKFIADRKPTNKTDTAGYCIALSIAAGRWAPKEVIASLIKALVKANASLDVDIRGNTGERSNAYTYLENGKKESWVACTTAISYLSCGYSQPLQTLTTEEVALLKELLGNSFQKLENINMEEKQKEYKYKYLEFTDKEISRIKQGLMATGRQDAKELCEKLIENKDMVKLLLVGGANITFRHFNWLKTPIHLAAVFHDFEMVELIASLRNTDEEDEAHFRRALFCAFAYPTDNEWDEKPLEELVEERVRAIIALLKAGTPTQQVFDPVKMMFCTAEVTWNNGIPRRYYETISYPEKNFTQLLKCCSNTELLTEMAELLKKINFNFKFDNSGILEKLLNESKKCHLEIQAATPFWASPPSNSTTTATTTATKEQEKQSTFSMPKK